ncbi:MAG: UbiA family prenyltransferase [Marmoricola sp.]
MTEPNDDDARAKPAGPPPPPPPPSRPVPPPPPALPNDDPKAAKKAAKAEEQTAKREAKLEAKAAKRAAKKDRKAEKKDVKTQRRLEPKPARVPIRPIYQLGLLTRSAHPVQAFVLAALVAGVAAWDHRGVGGTLVAAGGVLLTQLALGLMNDAYDASADARGERTKKPVASGALPPGNATYLAVVLVLMSLPVAALNGTIAGAALLLTLPVGFLHNRILHRTPASFFGWMVTFPLFATYLAYGGWGAGVHGNAPTWQVLVATGALGLTVHFLTSLPDLVVDHKAGLSELPLVIARRTGATVLLIITVVCLIAAAAATVWCGLHFGLRQR